MRAVNTSLAVLLHHFAFPGPCGLIFHYAGEPYPGRYVEARRLDISDV
jgi:hypothetical protein